MVLQSSDPEAAKLLSHFWLDSAISDFFLAPGFVRKIFAENGPGGGWIADGVVGSYKLVATGSVLQPFVLLARLKGYLVWTQ